MGNKASNFTEITKHIALIGLLKSGKSTIISVLDHNVPKTRKQLRLALEKHKPSTKTSLSFSNHNMHFIVEEYDGNDYNNWTKDLNRKYEKAQLDAIIFVYDASNAPIYIHLALMESLYFVLNNWCNLINISIETIPNDIIALIKHYLKEQLDIDHFIVDFLKTNYKSSGWSKSSYYQKPVLLFLSNKTDLKNTLSLNQIIMNLQLNRMNLWDCRWFIQDVQAINGVNIWDALNWLRNTLSSTAQ